MSSIAEFARGVKGDVTKEIVKRLVERKAQGPEEPALDGFIPQFQNVKVGLETGVVGKAVTNALRIAQLARLEKADSDVDTSFRHHFDYLDNEAIRRVGPHVNEAVALRDAAFPDALDPVDDYIPDENRVCRYAISILRTSPHKETAMNIGLPEAWTTKWEAEIDESEAAFSEVQKAREGTSASVVTGLDAETEFVDVAVRFRRYILSRASQSEKAKIAEGVELLAPLTEALAKARAEAAARKTRRKTAGAGKGAPAPAPEGAAGAKGAGSPAPEGAAGAKGAGSPAPEGAAGAKGAGSPAPEGATGKQEPG